MALQLVYSITDSASACLSFVPMLQIVFQRRSTPCLEAAGDSYSHEFELYALSVARMA
jgi:hypothetical protein